MGWKVGGFHRVKSKEERREQFKYIWLAGTTQPTSSGVRKNKEVRIEPRVGLAFGDWLTGYPLVLVKQSVYRGMEVSEVCICWCGPWDSSVSVLDLEIYFNQGEGSGSKGRVWYKPHHDSGPRAARWHFWILRVEILHTLGQRNQSNWPQAPTTALPISQDSHHCALLVTSVAEVFKHQLISVSLSLSLSLSVSRCLSRMHTLLLSLSKL